MKRMILTFAMVALALPMAAAASTGEELWNRHCQKCHGKNGNGDTPMGKRLNIANFTRKETQDSVTDTSAREAIMNGKKTESGRLAMFAFGNKLSEEEISLLVDYFRSLQAD